MPRRELRELQLPRGELILTAPVLFGRLHALPVVAEFLALYADIQVRLLLSDRNLHLIDEHVDIALGIGALASNRMVATLIGSTRTVVCASPELLASHGAPRDPRGPAALPCVNFDTLSMAPAWAFRAKDGKAAASPSRAMLHRTTELRASRTIPSRAGQRVCGGRRRFGNIRSTPPYSPWRSTPPSTPQYIDRSVPFYRDPFLEAGSKLA